MRCLYLCLLIILFPACLFAEEEHPHDDALYIDPLITEHAFLEKKIRFDFTYENRADFEIQDQPLNEESESEREDVASIASYRLIGEWFFHERFGMGLETALVHADPITLSNVTGFSDLEVEMKFLPWIDHENELIIAISFGLGIPTGNEDRGLGEGRVELEPGILFWKEFYGIVLQGQYNIVVELGSGQDPTFFKYNHSLAYPFELGNNYVQSFIPMLELAGRTPLNGISKGFNQLTLMPGFRMNFNSGISLGAGVQFPIGRRHEQETLTLVTLSKHF